MTTHLLMCSFKGLVVDLEDGNLVKLAEDGTVLRYTVLDLLSHTDWLFFQYCKRFFSDLTRATHGTMELGTEEIIKHYGSKREWKHFNNLNTSFTRSGRMCFMFINLNVLFNVIDWLLFCFLHGSKILFL